MKTTTTTTWLLKIIHTPVFLLKNNINNNNNHNNLKPSQSIRTSEVRVPANRTSIEFYHWIINNAINKPIAYLNEQTVYPLRRN